MNAPFPLNVMRRPAGDAQAVQRKRASAQISRLLIATPLVWMAGCAPQPTLQQDSYASLQDCVADWGEEDKCVEDKTSSNGSGNWRTPLFIGPTYWSNQRARLTRQNLEASRKLATAPAAGSSSQASNTRRSGGFGSTGRGYSSGGG
jgi:hypothetical protein